MARSAGAVLVPLEAQNRCPVLYTLAERGIPKERPPAFLPTGKCFAQKENRPPALCTGLYGHVLPLRRDRASLRKCYAARLDVGIPETGSELFPSPADSSYWEMQRLSLQPGRFSRRRTRERRRPPSSLQAHPHPQGRCLPSQASNPPISRSMYPYGLANSPQPCARRARL